MEPLNFRIALANLRIPDTREESVELACQAVTDAAAHKAGIICFPECFVPGYRISTRRVLPPDAAFLEDAWSRVQSSAADAGISVILGTERIAEDRPRISAMVIRPDGTIDGFQDKVQLDPSEDSIYSPGYERRLFHAGPLTFGIAICHEGFRYPETVRWAAYRGAHVVFHPHFHEALPGAYVASEFGDPANTFHEKTFLCRAAENTCYFASVNVADAGSSTTSAVIRPDGSLLCYQPYGLHGLLIADIDLNEATRLLAARWKPANVISA